MRIRAHAESTLKELAEKGAKTVVLAHQGRKGDPDYTSLKDHAAILGKILKCPVKYVDDVFGDKAKAAIKDLKGGEILVLENVRSWDKETKSMSPEDASKTELVQNLAPLADLFVNDAFAAAHRAHVSMVGFTAVLPSAAGRIMERELKSLSKALEKPEHPCVYVMGGAKADDSLEISKYVLGQRHRRLRSCRRSNLAIVPRCKRRQLGQKNHGFPRQERTNAVYARHQRTPGQVPRQNHLAQKTSPWT